MRVVRRHSLRRLIVASGGHVAKQAAIAHAMQSDDEHQDEIEPAHDHQADNDRAR